MSQILDPLRQLLAGPDQHRHIAALGGLVVVNVLLMAAYITGMATIGELMWTYWLQSVAIGLFNYRRMMALQRFSAEGLSSNGRPVPATPAGKRSTANFFLLHYGFFHLIYAVFLSVQAPAGLSTAWLGVAGLGFVAGEWNAHRHHVTTDAMWEPNIGTLFFQPYIRIIPMHIAIILSFFAGAILLPLKLGADIAMYVVDEHLDDQRAARQAAGGPVSPGVG